MPRLLVSVRDAAEARAALDGGADVVDVKEPSRGALGAADPAVWAAVLRVCDGRADVSVALGEAVDAPIYGRCPVLPAGVRWAKLGPAGLLDPAFVHPDLPWAEDLARARGSYDGGNGPVGWAAVAYADHDAARAPAPADLLAASAGCEVFLLDTFTKDGRGLFDRLTEDEVTRLCRDARAAGLTVALAGSLRLEDIPRALACGADVIAVRGAACDGPRTGRVCEGKVAALKAAVG